MRRLVLPELLDELPAEDPRARASRGDLQRLNVRMRSAEIFAKELARHFGESPPRRILELGAGDGSLLLKIARLLPATWSSVEAVLLDKQLLLSQEAAAQYQDLGWKVSSLKKDFFEWAKEEGQARHDLVLANLFLHHFKERDLETLFPAIASKCGTFLALEPRRSFFFKIVTRMLWLMGCNSVTRHDARISVQAGFRGNELSAFWPRSGTWRVIEKEAGWFSHMFMASQNAESK